MSSNFVITLGNKLVSSAFLVALLSCLIDGCSGLSNKSELINVTNNFTVDKNITVQSFYIAWDGESYIPNCTQTTA